MSDPVEKGGGPSPWGDRYPFVRPSADVRGRFVDAWVSHPDREARLPLRLVRLAGLHEAPASSSGSSGSSAGDPLPVRAWVEDADGRAVFDPDAGAAYKGRAWGPDLYVHEWVAADRVLRLVQRTGGDPWPAVLEPADGTLDERASEVVGPRVTALRVGGERLTGRVRLVAGYNARLDPGAPVTPTAGLLLAGGVRARTPVRLDLTPGLGLGVYPDCGPAEPVVRRVAGAAPDAAGNLRLAADGCLWVRRGYEQTSPTLVQFTAGVLHVGNDCGPCCPCEAYERVWAMQQRRVVRYTALGRRAEAVRDRFRENKDRWEAQKGCRESRPLRLLILSSRPDTVTVLASVCNAGKDCKPARIELDVRLLEGTPAFLPGGTFLTDPRTGDWAPGTLGGTAANSWAAWERVDPGRGVKLRTTLTFAAGSGCANAADVTARAVGPDGGVIQTLRKSVAVVCTTDGAMNVA